MKIIKFIPLLFILTFFNTSSFAETKKDCLFKADTGVKMYEKWKCKMGKTEGEGFGKKLKSIFKKKN